MDNSDGLVFMAIREAKLVGRIGSNGGTIRAFPSEVRENMLCQQSPSYAQTGSPNRFKDLVARIGLYSISVHQNPGYWSP